MYRMFSVGRHLRSLTLVTLGAAVACAPEIGVDADETPDAFEPGGHYAPDSLVQVEFDPGNGIIPFPNNLVMNPATGRVALPRQCGESLTATFLRTSIMNRLNGFGTWKSAIRLSLTQDVDADTLTDNIKLFKRVDGVTPVEPTAATEVPITIIPTYQERATPDCLGTTIAPTVIIIPNVPLSGDATYSVAVLDGVMSAEGEAFGAALAWNVVTDDLPPAEVDEDGNIIVNRTPLEIRVTDPDDDEAIAEAEANRESVLGLLTLWNAHQGVLDFMTSALSNTRKDILLAWDFRTQSTTSVFGSDTPNSMFQYLPETPLHDGDGNAPTSIVTGTAEEHMAAVLPTDTCLSVPCSAVGDVLLAKLDVAVMQTEVSANPLDPSNEFMIPGPFNDPANPTPTGASIIPEMVDALVFVPASTAPADGYPVVIFGHGVTRTKEDLYGIASQLNAYGIAAVAIDWVAHGSRAFQATDDPLYGCDGTVDYFSAPQCFAPIFNTDLAISRDNFRQSILDASALVSALVACGTTECGALQVDADNIGYMGQSLGSLMGSTVVAANPIISGSVLNVGGGSWGDVLEQTDSAGIRCPLIDGLIGAGVIDGELWGGSNPDAFCMQENWFLDPGWQSFAVIIRWVLDPADSANFSQWLVGRSVLIQEVVDDEVVPNISTQTLAGLMGLSSADADVLTDPGSAIPSAALLANTNDPKYLRYHPMTADGSIAGAGDTLATSYTHGSLLSPGSTGDSFNGLVRLQTDAITYLVNQIGTP